jgi:hypothetical protein
MNILKTYNKAIELLKENSTEKGFLASKEERNNYKRIWSRDGVVQGIAAISSEEKELIKTFKQNLISLKEYQDKTGRIPSNIDFKKKQVSYGTIVGKIDATLWYVIGVGKYYSYTKDRKFLRIFYKSLKKAIDYLKCLELNGKGLLYIPTGGDWSDEYISEGYVLFDQILYYLSLKEYEKMSKELNQIGEINKINKKINKLKEIININYFPSKSKLNHKAVYSKGLYKKIANEFKEDYALISFCSNGFQKHLDSFANSLLLSTDILDEKKKKKVLKTLNQRLKSQKMKILPAFWPSITPKEKSLYKILEMNSLFEFRNTPHNYHNGGLWPLIQGFYITGLVKTKKNKLAKKYLKEFSEALEGDNYQFHEYFESKNYTPSGHKKIGFSAAGYIIAYNSLIKNKKIL